ncbi:MAG: 4'-phosphopantetheinyl transferase superfamily protein [Clostridia bacterium]|nr:4'-phosphopantetheinyl transferase superfamily protein [Clostridia bacterium]
MIYFTDATAFDMNDTIWQSLLSPARKQRISALKQPEDKQRSLAVELLLCFALKNEFSNITLPASYHYDSNGKPISNMDGIYFSLSHSGRYVACAVAPYSIGVDIQWQKEADQKTVEKVLTKNQLEMIRTMPPKKQQSAYYDFWCLKEALYKVTGEGSVRQPTEFEFSNLGGRLGISKDELNLQNYSTVPGYSLGVCATGVLPHCIFQVSIEKIKEMVTNDR